MKLSVKLLNPNGTISTTETTTTTSTTTTTTTTSTTTTTTSNNEQVPSPRSHAINKKRTQYRNAVVLDQYGFVQKDPKEAKTDHDQATAEANTPIKLNIKQSFVSSTTVLKWDQYVASLKGDYDKVKRNKQLKYLIRLRGIPSNLRGPLWPRMSNSHKKKEENFQEYLNLLKSKGHLENPYTQQIEKDLPRTFPTNIWFHTDAVQTSLRHILHAFTWYRPAIGYCQAMNFLAAVLLFFIEEEEAFWTVCTVVDNMLPRDYYCNNLRGVRVDVEVFRALFQQRLPKLAKHFSDLEVDPGIFVTQWFLCLFINVLPLESAFRFLDCFFYEGSKMLFRVALALFNANQAAILQTENAATLLDVCQGLPQAATDPQLVIDYAYDEITMKNFSNKIIADLRKQSYDKIIQEEDV